MIDMNFGKEEAKRYIVPVLGTTDGCGVLVGNLFITAGHLLKHGPIDVKIEDRLYRLDKDMELTRLDIAENEKNKDGLDLAVFRIEDAWSPFVLDEDDVAKGETLESLSYVHHSESVKGTSIFNTVVKESYVPLQCTFMVGKKIGNYLLGTTSAILKGGSSGSPAFRGEKVAGIVYGGKPGKAVCAFLSAKAIAEFLKSKNIL